MKSFFDNRIIVKVGDITLENTDAIVNAANSSLMGGGGVDGAIHRAGGPKILEECKLIRKNKYPSGLPTGEAVSTSGGNLKAKCVIHTVGPIWYGGKNNEEKLLANAYLNSLKEAENLNCKSVAFPSISTGIYGFPKEKAAKIVSNVLRDYIKNKNKIEKIVLVFFSESDYKIFLDNCDWE